MRNSLIQLRTKEVQGATILYHNYEVFAEKRSVTGSEFYAGYQVGLSPSFTFVCDVYDYEASFVDGVAPSSVLYDGKEFNIIRTYETNHGTIEIKVGEK